MYLTSDDIIDVHRSAHSIYRKITKAQSMLCEEVSALDSETVLFSHRGYIQLDELLVLMKMEVFSLCKSIEDLIPTREEDEPEL